MGCTIIGSGKSLPPLTVENDDLTALVDTSDEWIRQRTGIHRRHISVAESGTDLAEAAAREALGWGRSDALSSVIATPGLMPAEAIDPASIDLLVYSTITPDTLVPSAASMLRRRLGLDRAAAFDVNAACTGFIYALSLAENMLAASACAADQGVGRPTMRRALVVASERLTRITNWADRNTCVLFADGAGAAVVEWNPDRPGIRSFYLRNDDDPHNALTCPAAYDSVIPFATDGVTPEAMAEGNRALDSCDPALAQLDAELEVDDLVAEGRPRQSLYMHGQRVFKFATHAMVEAVEHVLDQAGLALDDVKVFVPHQANERIIAYAAKKLGVPIERFQLSIAEWGNVSSACVPMALADAYASGRIQPGDNVVLVAFGGGFTSGAVLFEA
ncbi:3-oxoacyl-ACP synthase III family protein [Xiamenia xianingshaonis]|uniref:Beta-ketoacyl-ACP synthase 3 n=1 Tax=Xiamenia xianingshaonis TaxID=2682776 RepID=A0A9E6MQ52_9ACTN|nr:beta-ketoacyl-ACP synthase 3 [Xiamenia xianingshaonis]NHM13889.1 beta-ketoacyl-ACP synthase 3 [Xiamenia xianingshaonis]QTU84419.1 beta-ketoacyl-ACP synthase 3 [Xiamenia xianingshaonis]